MLKVGDQAPEYSLVDQDNKTHKLSGYRGKRVLLYFYPKDQTPGCIKEACGFRDVIDELKGKAIILGVSADSVKSHQSFAAKYNLNFPLLSDPDKAIIRAYGADGIILAKRTSFLISPDGHIEKIYTPVNPSIHAVELLQDISG